MKRRTRTYYTDGQKALMWERSSRPVITPPARAGPMILIIAVFDQGARAFASSPSFHNPALKARPSADHSTPGPLRLSPAKPPS